MNQPRQRLLKAVLAIAAMFATVTISSAQAPLGDPLGLSLAKMQGPWAATIVGNTGCGLGTMYVTFRLNAAGQGTGTATIVTHAQCGDGTASGLDFNITSLDFTNGSGTAGLTCCRSCGWVLKIQVAKNGQIFSLADVDPSNPNNYIAGTAIHQ